MLVYRVQTQSNCGPYGWTSSGVDKYFDLEKHPIPQHDGMDTSNLTPDYYFGFKSVEQLEAWFCPEQCRILRDGDYLLYTYIVPDSLVIVGRKQVCFIHKHALLRNVYSLSNKDDNYYRLSLKDSL